MLRVVTLAILICTSGCLLDQNNGDFKTAPELSLTLIPPSPVTDQIELDIRAGISDNGYFPKTVTVFFYLDEEKKENILFQQQITVDLKSPKGIKFRWSTKNKAGNHKIILVCQDGKKSLRSERALQIIPSDIRSTRKIDGAFMGFYHWSETEGKFWNADIKKMTDDQWRELVNAQHKLDMNIIVMQELFRNQMYVGKHKI